MSNFWRGVAGFFVFLIGWFLLAALLELLFGLANLVADNWSEKWSHIIGAAIGGFVGVGGGKLALDKIIKDYPAKSIASVFIALNAIVAIGDLIIVPMQSYDVTVGVQIARAATASVGAYYVLWMGRNLT
jgi:hypothetical protein